MPLPGQGRVKCTETSGTVKKLPCLQRHLNRHFLLKGQNCSHLKSKNSILWRVRGSSDSTKPANNKKRRLLFISAKLGTVSSVSEVLGTKQSYSCWDAAHRCIAEKRQVTASWQYFLLHSKYADSAGCPACLCLFLCWAQAGVTQVRLHIDIQEAQRAFIYFLHVAERALKGAC